MFLIAILLFFLRNNTKASPCPNLSCKSRQNSKIIIIFKHKSVKQYANKIRKYYYLYAEIHAASDLSDLL
jgi:hypothetical protein